MSLPNIAYTSYTIAVCLAVFCFWLISLQEPRHEQRNIMIMAAVTVVQTLGYWSSLHAVNLESAIFAQKLIMCGGVFMFYSMLLVVCSTCEVNIPLKVKQLLMYIAAAFCLIFANFERFSFVYKEYHFTLKNGMPILELSYGFVYLLFVVMIFSYISVLSVISVKSFIKANTTRKRIIASLLLVFEIVPTIAFIVDKTGGIGFSLIPLGYTIAESIIIFLIYFLKIYDVKNVAMLIAFNNSEDGIIITDSCNRYQDANSKARELFPELIKLSNNDSIKGVSPLIDRIIIDGSDKEVVSYDHLYQPKIQPITSESKHTGNVVWLKDITLERKNTELLEAHRQALQSDVALKTELLEKAEAATRSKSEFLAKMSHEIRTPMNAIVGMAELSLRESTSPEAKKYAIGIKQASANLLTIINDILDFSKIESGKLEITNQKYLLGSLINDVISIIRIRVIDKSLLFVVNIDSNLPAELIGDEIRIRQILLNLLGNAAKYTKEGYITLTVGGSLSDGHTATLDIAVTDTGVGIKEENIANLFSEFAQFDVLKNRGIEGTGLGLAITKSLCVAMGGDIKVKSVYGEGSVFTVTLPQEYETYTPFAAVNDKEQQVIIYEPREVYRGSVVFAIDNLGIRYTLAVNRSELYEALQKDSYSFLFFSSFLYESVREIVKEMKLSPKLVALSEYGEVMAYQGYRSIAMPVHAISIANVLNDVEDDTFYHSGEESGVRFIAPKARILVVDDIVTNLKVAEGLLAPYEMQIDVCERGAEAIALVSKTQYDIVFMDHMMPEMDGVEATNKIRSLDLPYAAVIPIVALTANAVSGVKEMFLQSGFDDFLSKPIEMSKMDEILDRFIPKEKRERVIAKEKVAKEIPFQLSNVDVARGIRAVGGSAEQYINILQVFLRDGRSKLEELSSCLEQGNVALYTTHVHALKSVLAGIGAEKLSGVAKSLELAGNQENVGYINDTHNGFVQDLTALLDEIEGAVGQSTVPQTEALTDEQRSTQLIRLKTALQDYNATVIGSALSMLKSGCENAIKDTLTQIERHVSAFNYEEAEQLVYNLIQFNALSDGSEPND